jgi:hypothetical protein
MYHIIEFANILRMNEIKQIKNKIRQRIQSEILS